MGVTYDTFYVNFGTEYKVDFTECEDGPAVDSDGNLTSEGPQISPQYVVPNQDEL